MKLSMITIVLLAGASLLQADSKSNQRLQQAAAVFTEAMEMKDQSIPQDLLNKAHCVVIVPGLKKGAFIIGGKFGRGFAHCRANGGQGWTAPAAMRVEGGSLGFQIGGSETDVIMLVMNESGKNKLISSKFTLGGDASAAAGPVGRTAAAQTDVQMRAEILTYSRARGVFAGISLDGATLRPDSDVNEILYGSDRPNREILSGEVPPPEAAKQLLSTLNKYSPKEMK
jgi:lipid-binding SYLF domain-containing protein